jgi:putative Mg2+ transporter-C (MgtC) family protein
MVSLVYVDIVVKGWNMHHDLVIVGHLCLALVLGYAIGWERELRGAVAGERAFALVAVATAAMASLATDGHYEILPAILIGIGFLGGGVVSKKAVGEQRGVTTAATVWTVAVLGIFIGLGRIFLPIAVTLLILFVLELEHIPILRRLDMDLRRAEREQTSETVAAAEGEQTARS